MFRPRFSLATLMMVIIAAASASALLARVVKHLPMGGVASTPVPKWDLAGAFVLGIVLTGFVLAVWRKHSTSQTMLQITLTCLDVLCLIRLGESDVQRLAIWWFQASFAVLVFAPLMVRRAVESGSPPSSRRAWRATTCEAVALSFLNMLLAFAGQGAQYFWVYSFDGEFKF